MFLEKFHELWEWNVESVHAVGGSRGLRLLLTQPASLLEFAHGQPKVGGIPKLDKQLLIGIEHIFFLLEEEENSSILFKNYFIVKTLDRDQ